MGTFVLSMHKGDLCQAKSSCGAFLLFLFSTSLKNMQAEKKKASLVPLGIFVFYLLRLLWFILGLAICLLLFAFRQVLGLGHTGSGCFVSHATSALRFGTAGRTPQHLPLAGPEELCWCCCSHYSFPIVSPVSFPQQPAMTAAGFLMLWAARAYLSASPSSSSQLLTKTPSLSHG